MKSLYHSGPGRIPLYISVGQWYPATAIPRQLNLFLEPWKFGPRTEQTLHADVRAVYPVSRIFEPVLLLTTTNERAFLEQDIDALMHDLFVYWRLVTRQYQGAVTCGFSLASYCIGIEEKQRYVRRVCELVRAIGAMAVEYNEPSLRLPIFMATGNSLEVHQYEQISKSIPTHVRKQITLGVCVEMPEDPVHAASDFHSMASSLEFVALVTQLETYYEIQKTKEVFMTAQRFGYQPLFIQPDIFPLSFTIDTCYELATQQTRNQNRHPGIFTYLNFNNTKKDRNTFRKACAQAWWKHYQSSGKVPYILNKNLLLN